MQTFIYCNVKLYMFRASQRPSSGVPKTVSATSGIGHAVKYRLELTKVNSEQVNIEPNITVTNKQNISSL
jgi:hypothetical protein